MYEMKEGGRAPLAPPSSCAPDPEGKVRQWVSQWKSDPVSEKWGKGWLIERHVKEYNYRGDWLSTPPPAPHKDDAEWIGGMIWLSLYKKEVIKLLIEYQ